jgi:hypothetical protein
VRAWFDRMKVVLHAAAAAGAGVPEAFRLHRKMLTLALENVQSGGCGSVFSSPEDPAVSLGLFWSAHQLTGRVLTVITTL